jgi:hypothetical protein
MGGMLGKTSAARHAVVVAEFGGTTLLAATGVIGGGDHPERFDQWQSVVEPAGGNGVRITDTFDQDFGTTDRRGHETYIAHDAGVPTDISASSPDAPDDLGVVDLGTETRVRIGDPDVTISGQHRYTLAYTLPQAMVEGGVLSVDVLDPDELEIDRFELVVTDGSWTTRSAWSAASAHRTNASWSTRATAPTAGSSNRWRAARASRSRATSSGSSNPRRSRHRRCPTGARRTKDCSRSSSRCWV